MFPTVHGNDEVKRGIMLMLFGGVPKTTLEGTTLRSVSSCCFTIPASVSDSKRFDFDPDLKLLFDSELNSD